MPQNVLCLSSYSFENRFTRYFVKKTYIEHTCVHVFNTPIAKVSVCCAVIVFEYDISDVSYNQLRILRLCNSPDVPYHNFVFSLFQEQMQEVIDAMFEKKVSVCDASFIHNITNAKMSNLLFYASQINRDEKIITLHKKATIP